MRNLAALLLGLLTIILSVIISQIYFSLALTMIPPAAMSSMNQSAGRVTFFLYGLGLGILGAILFLICLWLAPRLFRRS